MQELFAIAGDELLPLSRAVLSVRDLAVQRGYGIFDFLKTVDGAAVFLDEHLDRFFASATRMRLDPGKSPGELREMIALLQRRNGLAYSGIRLTLTGGCSPDSYTMGPPALVIQETPLSVMPGSEPSTPIRLVSYPHRRQLPDVKTIDYLMAIWLQPYIRDKGADDVLYVSDGIISECPRSNFFVVTASGVVVTPGQGVLRGVVRGKVLELARRQFQVEERDIALSELATAREAFITSTTRHILPVMRVDDIVIGGPGPVSQWLSRELYRLVKG